MDQVRESLARDQAGLVAALTSGAAAPADFDRARLALAARTLMNKRFKSVAKSWPVLARSLGDEFEVLFRGYARENPVPTGGAFADGRAFARHLMGRNRLVESAHVELLVHEAGTGPGIRAARVGTSRRPVVVLRVPGLGVRVIWLLGRATGQR